MKGDIIKITDLLIILLIVVFFGMSCLMFYWIGFFNGVDIGITIELVNKTIEHSTLLEI